MSRFFTNVVAISIPKHRIRLSKVLWWVIIVLILILICLVAHSSCCIIIFEEALYVLSQSFFRVVVAEMDTLHYRNDHCNNDNVRTPRPLHLVVWVKLRFGNCENNPKRYCRYKRYWAEFHWTLYLLGYQKSYSAVKSCFLLHSVPSKYYSENVHSYRKHKRNWSL